MSLTTEKLPPFDGAPLNCAVTFGGPIAKDCGKAAVTLLTQESLALVLAAIKRLPPGNLAPHYRARAVCGHHLALGESLTFHDQLRES